MSDEQIVREVNSLKKLVEVIAARPVRHGKHGLPGRDGVGIPGRDGRDGKDVDPELVVQKIDVLVKAEVAKIPVPQDGKDGSDGKEVARAGCREGQGSGCSGPDAEGRQGWGGTKGDPGPRGKQGEKGERGEPGPMGPRPDHEWRGSELRFEHADGSWGEYVDLRGPPGRNGASFAAVWRPRAAFRPGPRSSTAGFRWDGNDG